MISVGDILAYYVPNRITRNLAIRFVKHFSMIKERLIYPKFSFAQICKVHNYGQYKLPGSIINVPQSLLLCVHVDETIVGILLKCCLEYKFPYMFGKIQPTYYNDSF